ncbi:hypothetical protein [Lentibacter sp. XHP0401]|uniref:hypothetical protein n=1 Tax=Lentibacter sp. XHP0401 TaxID=2984334 RepID=UPI0021E748F8|nr:hypothetical protein [Lentibacter sp. XHP0401]MCV2892228.1 hypothetical protein [Lentibacter sp. XHP0401]
MMYSWKYSAALLGIAAITFVVFLNIEQRTLAIVTGTTISAVLDLRFLILFVVGFMFSGRVNPLFLALTVGALRSAYLQITLQDYWARLEIRSPTPFDTFWPAFLGGLILFSLRHAISGMWQAEK